MKNLSEYINNRFFRVITKASRELNYDSYVIGGYVRDILLNRPSNDIDVVTVGSGIELARKTASLIDTKKEVKYYGRFGTAMIRMKDKEIEFVGARRESYEPSSRKPMVEDGTLEDDQNRRDFTINALAISLNEDTFGELVDPFNGVQDLEDKILPGLYHNVSHIQATNQENTTAISINNEFLKFKKPTKNSIILFTKTLNDIIVVATINTDAINMSLFLNIFSKPCLIKTSFLKFKVCIL